MMMDSTVALSLLAIFAVACLSVSGGGRCQYVSLESGYVHEMQLANSTTILAFLILSFSPSPDAVEYLSFILSLLFTSPSSSLPGYRKESSFCGFGCWCCRGDTIR